MLRLYRLALFTATICVICALSVDAQAMPVAQDGPARLFCRVEPGSLALNQSGTLIIEVANMQNLYGYELNMIYDPSLVQMQDADPAESGVNLDLNGKFLSPDFVLKNSAENGGITIILTQLLPSQAKSGSGELARITFTGTSAGFVSFAFLNATFSDTEGIAILVTPEDCLAEIGTTGAPTPTATLTSTPTFTATSLPSQTPTSSPMPTSTPGSTPIATQVPQSNTAPPTATFTPVPPTATYTPVPQSAQPTATFTPLPPTATDTATPFVPPTATATVLVITTPTPQAVDGGPRGQEVQSQPASTEPAVAPTATLIATVKTVIATVETVTSSPADGITAATPTSPALETPTAVPTTSTSFATTAPSSNLAPGQEVLSPPQIALEAGNSSLASTHAAQSEKPSIDPTATPTQTPLRIARAEVRPPRAKIVVDQPAAMPSLILDMGLRTVAWIAFLGACLLGFVAWRLRGE